MQTFEHRLLPVVEHVCADLPLGNVAYSGCDGLEESLKETFSPLRQA